MDISGMTWLLNEKNEYFGCINIMSPPSRFADSILGIYATRNRPDMQVNQPFKDHFGYQENNSLGEQYQDNKYAAITKMDRVIYSTVWEMVGRYNNDNFQQIEDDNTVNKLYSSRELDVYFVVSQTNRE
jgi:hypothetical protein